MQTPPLIKRLPDQEIEINPVTAEEMNIHLRDWLWIEIPRFRERVKLLAKITENILPWLCSCSTKLVVSRKTSAEHGCFESNINAIISDEPPEGANLRLGPA